jgi:hypothetical protein
MQTHLPPYVAYLQAILLVLDARYFLVQWGNVHVFRPKVTLGWKKTPLFRNTVVVTDCRWVRNEWNCGESLSMFLASTLVDGRNLEVARKGSIGGRSRLSWRFRVADGLNLLRLTGEQIGIQ